ncbi:hypothetical protein ACFPRL_22225 [Pseudoclavibacter helvolus]
MVLSSIRGARGRRKRSAEYATSNLGVRPASGSVPGCGAPQSLTTVTSLPMRRCQPCTPLRTHPNRTAPRHRLSVTRAPRQK